MWKVLEKIQKLRCKILKLKIKCAKHTNKPIRDDINAKTNPDKVPQVLGGGGSEALQSKMGF